MKGLKKLIWLRRHNKQKDGPAQPKNTTLLSEDDILITGTSLGYTDGVLSLNPSQLACLMEARSINGLNQYGGVIGLASALQVDLAQGLPEDLRRASQERFGSNQLPPRSGPTLWRLMLEAFLDKILLMLTAAALISLAIGIYQDHRDGTASHWIEGAAILAAVIIVVMVNALNDWQRDRQFRALAAKSEDRQVNILRQGQPMRISIFDLVVGDICLLEPGVLDRQYLKEQCCDNIYLFRKSCPLMGFLFKATTFNVTNLAQLVKLMPSEREKPLREIKLKQIRSYSPGLKSLMELEAY